ncbi:MAG: hypothetical protein JWM98_1839 [Thermoleophilia bacterium]|nr:hypothetical protein [Thermoleophilia bacterium]
MSERRLTPKRQAAIVAWLLAFSTYAVLVGLPTKRSNVLIWVSLAVCAVGIDRPLATLRSFATTWLPLFAALAAYDLLRGSSDGAIASAHTFPQLDLDLWLGGGRTLSERLQGWLWHPGHPHWWDYVAWGTYQSHFFASMLIGVLLWSLRDRRAAPYLLGLAALSWMALATYFLYPAQPPWMTARDGLTGDVARVIQGMWHNVGVDRAARAFTTSKVDGSRYSNPVAALPSLHAAFPVFIAVSLWSRRWYWNLLLVAYPLLMAFSLVYAGEHFALDVLLGWAYALAVGLTVRWWASRRATPAPLPDDVLHDAAGAAAEPRVLTPAR